jgi:hypothetical protein
MIKTFLTLIVALLTTTVFANEIEATVVFENMTNKELTSGQFINISTNHKIDVNNTESFKITLPEKGKYIFTFTSGDFNVYTIYPAKMSSNKNIITVRLTNKLDVNSTINVSSSSKKLDLKTTNDEIENLISKGSVNFILHGIDNTVPEDYLAFKDKYGIGVRKENCAINPISYKHATMNNKVISQYLTSKYGTEWLNELQVKPFGIK